MGLAGGSMNRMTMKPTQVTLMHYLTNIAQRTIVRCFTICEASCTRTTNVVNGSASNLLSKDRLEDVRNPVVVVGRAEPVRGAAHPLVTVGHRPADPGPLEHRQVVGHVAEGPDVRGVDAESRGPPFQAGGLGHPARVDLRQAVRAGEVQVATVADDLLDGGQELLDGQVGSEREQLADRLGSDLAPGPAHRPLGAPV